MLLWSESSNFESTFVSIQCVFPIWLFSALRSRASSAAWQVAKHSVKHQNYNVKETFSPKPKPWPWMASSTSHPKMKICICMLIKIQNANQLSLVIGHGCPAGSHPKIWELIFENLEQWINNWAHHGTVGHRSALKLWINYCLSCLFKAFVPLLHWLNQAQQWFLSCQR